MLPATATDPPVVTRDCTEITARPPARLATASIPSSPKFRPGSAIRPPLTAMRPDSDENASGPRRARSKLVGPVRVRGAMKPLTSAACAVPRSARLAVE